MTRYTSDSSNFGADGPFFRIIREGLEGLADGEDYFDLLTDDLVFEYVISVPGYPRRVEGRQNIIDLYSGYGDFITVHRADHLRVYRVPKRRSSSSSTKCTAKRRRQADRTTIALSPSSPSTTAR